MTGSKGTRLVTLTMYGQSVLFEVEPDTVFDHLQDAFRAGFAYPTVGDISEANWMTWSGGMFRFAASIGQVGYKIERPIMWLIPPELKTKCPKCGASAVISTKSYNHGCGVTRLELVIAGILPDPYL